MLQQIENEAVSWASIHSCPRLIWPTTYAPGISTVGTISGSTMLMPGCFL
jgi:hypothetical protein